MCTDEVVPVAVIEFKRSSSHIEHLNGKVGGAEEEQEDSTHKTHVRVNMCPCARVEESYKHTPLRWQDTGKPQCRVQATHRLKTPRTFSRVVAAQDASVSGSMIGCGYVSPSETPANFNCARVARQGVPMMSSGRRFSSGTHFRMYDPCGSLVFHDVSGEI